LWTQLDIVNKEAAELAEQAGLKVVMDRCPKIELAKLY
jgi:predicted CoA-binding protein